LQFISKSSLLNSNVVKNPGGKELFSFINDLNKFFIPSGISLFSTKADERSLNH
jgi:hypothetical protein